MKEQTTRTPPKLRVLSAFLAVAMLLNLAAPLALADSVKCTVAGVELTGDVDSVPTETKIAGQVSYLNNTLTFHGDVTLTTVGVADLGTIPLIKAISEKNLRLVANGKVTGKAKGNGIEGAEEIDGGEYDLTYADWGAYSDTKPKGILGRDAGTTITAGTKITLKDFHTGIGGGSVQIKGTVNITGATFEGATYGIANSTTMNPGSELEIHADRYIMKDCLLTYNGGHLLMNVAENGDGNNIVQGRLSIGNVSRFWYRTDENGAYTEITVNENFENFTVAIGQNQDYLELTDVDPDQPESESYDLWVAGKQVTETNQDDVLDNGTVSYDPDSKTLTLNGTIKAAAADTKKTGAIIKTEDALTITGNAALEWDGGDSDDAPIGILAAGVTAETGKLTLSGAVLEITAGAGGIDLPVGSLTIENQTRLTVKSGGRGIEAGGTLEISNAQLDLDTVDDAIRVGSTARIENSTFTITGLDEYNDEGGMQALITEDGDLIVENSKITAMDTGDEGYYYQYGLRLGGKLEVSNSVLTLGAQNCAIDADSMEARGSNSKITAAVDDENSVPVQVDDTAVILHDDLEVTEGALNTECPKVVIEYASPHKVEGDYTYEITTDGNVRILAYEGSEADVVVPATLGGRDVTEIGNSARPVFNAIAAIRSITFPDTLKEMSGLPLFYGCENLETITIPASVTGMNFHSVADCFIFNCPNLKTIIFKGTRAQWEAIEKEYVNLDGITVRCSDDNVDPVQPDPDQPEQPDPGDPDNEDVFLQFEDCSVDVEKPDGTTLHFDALTGVIQSQRLPKGAKVTITLDEKAIPEGMKFSCWVFDPRPEDLMEDGTTATFTMQEDIGVLAKFSTLEEDDSSADFGTIAAATAVVGVVGATAYFVGTEVALNQLLPAGTSVPQDRAQLALLLWNTAGRPEPAALPAFADVTDPDTAKAAQWCMEAGFFQPREDGNFKPGKHVSRWKVLRTYQRIVK